MILRSVAKQWTVIETRTSDEMACTHRSCGSSANIPRLHFQVPRVENP